MDRQLTYGVIDDSIHSMLDQRLRDLKNGIHREEWIVTCIIGSNIIYNTSIDEKTVSHLLDMDKKDFVVNSLVKFIFCQIEDDLMEYVRTNYLH